MSLRSKWQVKLPVEVVFQQATARALHHEERGRDWEKRQQEAVAALKEHGLEFRDTPMTGGSRVQAILDPQRQQAVEECRSKRDGHTRKSEEYHSFARVLMLMNEYGATEVELDAEDIQYFQL